MKIAHAIEILYKLKNKLDINSKLMIYRSLIESRLNYLAIIYAHTKNNNDSSKTILPIYGSHKYQVLIFVFKCINRIGKQ